MSKIAFALWQYRGFMLESVKREFRARYAGPQFGAFWNLVQPLAMMVIYLVVFSELMRPRLPGSEDPLAYGIYLCAGMIPWMFFVEVMQRTLGMFIENANLLKKSNFPRLTLPLIILFSALLNVAVLFVIYIGFLAVSGRFPGWATVAIVPVLVLQAVFATPRGIIELLARHGIDLAGRHVVVIGRGTTVGRTMGLLLTRRDVNATVTLTHTGTRDLGGHIRAADVIIAAAGVPGIVTLSAHAKRYLDRARQSSRPPSWSTR